MDYGTKDRLDIPIWNAVESNNFKQALKLVDKRLTKNESAHLEALKLYILSRSSNLQDRILVLNRLEEYAEIKLIFERVDDIGLCSEAYEKIFPGNDEGWSRIIGNMRWQSVKTEGRNEELSLKCLRECLLKSDLEHAQQIVNSLEKNFPDNHSYIFWNITISFLYSTNVKYPERNRTLLGRLAFGQIAKIAAAASKLEESRLKKRTFQTPQEILLLHRISEKYSSPQQRLAYLDDTLLGPDSHIAKGEWQLWREKLFLLRSSCQWQRLFEIAGSLLQRSRIEDATGKMKESRMADWIVWKAYIDAALELDDDLLFDKATIEINAHIHSKSKVDKTWQRNASLAKIRLSFKQSLIQVGPSGQIGENSSENDQLCNILDYLQKYGHTTTAYDDIKSSVERLNLNEKNRLLNFLLDLSLTGSKLELDGPIHLQDTDFPKPSLFDLKTTGAITELLNKYKVIYLLVCFHRRHEDDQRVERCCSKNFADYASLISNPCAVCLKSLANITMSCYRFCTDILNSHKSSVPTDRNPADDFCVMSAMCLSKIALIEYNRPGLFRDHYKQYLLQAIALLELGWLNSKANFQILLLLIRLYSHMGCGSLVLRSYQRLGLKQIQSNTLGYILLDRISTFHPHAFSRVGIYTFDAPNNPIEHFSAMQKVVKRSQEQIADNIWRALENNCYDSIFQMKEVSDSLSSTMMGMMSTVECSKISLTLCLDLQPAKIFKFDGKISSKFQDTNDYRSHPNFESSFEPTFEELSRHQPKISGLRCKTLLMVEKFKLIVNPDKQSERQRQKNYVWLKSIFRPSYVDAKFKNGFNFSYLKDMGLTYSEFLVWSACLDMADIIIAVWELGTLSNTNLTEEICITGFQLLNERLEHQVMLVETIDSTVPAFADTLHILYSAFELSQVVTKFNGCFQKLFSNQARESQAIAHNLGQAVLSAGRLIKEGLDGGGWIDNVLNSLQMCSNESSGTDSNKSFVGTDPMNPGDDDSFQEDWAGQVVESWRDSMLGLVSLKTE